MTAFADKNASLAQMDPNNVSSHPGLSGTGRSVVDREAGGDDGRPEHTRGLSFSTTSIEVPNRAVSAGYKRKRANGDGRAV